MFLNNQNVLNPNLLLDSMFQHRSTNGLSSGRKQQTAVKQTVDRPKSKSWYNDNINHRIHPYATSSINLNHQLINEDNNWLKSSTRIFDDSPELDLSCQEEILTEAQLQNYPTQVGNFELFLLENSLDLSLGIRSNCSSSITSCSKTYVSTEKINYTRY
jgi:hypothetical protein